MFKFVRKHSQSIGDQPPTNTLLKAHSMEGQTFETDRGPPTLAAFPVVSNFVRRSYIYIYMYIVYIIYIIISVYCIQILYTWDLHICLVPQNWLKGTSTSNPNHGNTIVFCKCSFHPLPWLDYGWFKRINIPCLTLIHVNPSINIMYITLYHTKTHCALNEVRMHFSGNFLCSRFLLGASLPARAHQFNWSVGQPRLWRWGLKTGDSAPINVPFEAGKMMINQYHLSIIRFWD